MKNCRKKQTWLDRCLVPIALAGAVLLFSGCRTVSFYAQAIKGQCQILTREKSVTKLLAKPDTPESLRRRLEVLQAIREFAARDLSLHVDGQYAKYANLDRRYVVWNVQAAPKFSLEPKTWWYPLVGRLDYRGYFSTNGAAQYADYLEKKGYDVFVGGVEAYSTLGWFKDPALNTFLFNSDADVAETIFHELAHQWVFVAGDTDFNEAFATSVGEEGTLRWLRARATPQACEYYQTCLKRNREFVDLVRATRQRLAALYGDIQTEAGGVKAGPRSRQAPAESLRPEKERILSDFRRECEKLEVAWNSSGKTLSLDPSWLSGSVNNAQLNSVATYYDLVPGFQNLLAENAGNMEAFYRTAKALAKKPELERHRELHRLAASR